MGSTHGMGESWMYGQPGTSAAERDLWVLVDGKLNVNQQCPGSQEVQTLSWGHQGQHHQMGKGGDCPTLLCTGVTSP